MSEKSNKVIFLSRKKRAKLIVAALIVVVVLPLTAFGAYSALNYDRVYAGQYLGGQNLYRLNRADLKKTLSARASQFTSQTINLHYTSDKGDKNYQLKPEEIGLNYDIDAMADDVWNVGRSGGAFQSFWSQFKTVFTKTEHSAIYTYNEQAFDSKLTAIAKETDSPEKDYSLVYKDGRFSLSSDRTPGARIDQPEIKSNLKNRFAVFQNTEIAFAAKSYAPQVSEEKATNRLGEANKVLAGGDLVLEYQTQVFKLDTDTIGGTIKSKTSGDDLELIFDDKRINSFLDTIAASLNVEPQNAKLTIKDGKATVFQTSVVGRTLNKDKSKSAIIEALLGRISNQSAAPAKVTLSVETKDPEIADSAISNLGIVELVGTATTDFKGSPSNRVHNIQTGAAAINGVLVKPGDEFSTLGQLGEISDKSGYLPELVIKENQTIPEFGGGLCQVSSTLFRAALNAGTKITDRQNHKYRVGYYEPPIGMDATIYDPAPDFKFQNNYASHLLIQSKVEGTKITFDFYGTKDTRTIEIGTPTTWDPVDPGPPVEVQTDTLAPGERKQTEKAHAGISAKFHYKVFKDGQKLQETDFISKYTPWPEKWLVGKQPTAEPTPAPEAAPAAQ